MLDRYVLGQAQEVHDRSDALAVEANHQVVAQRQVEPRLARVALTTGSATQLVVDATRLVALGAEHVQAAELDDLVVLGATLRLGLFEGVVPRRLVLVRRLVGRKPAIPQRQVGAELRVAAQHDVGAATGHVGRHRHRSLAAGVGDDRRLPSVVLRVEYLVRDATAQQ